MYNAMLLTAALSAGQIAAPRTAPIQVLPPLIVPSGRVVHVQPASGTIVQGPVQVVSHTGGKCASACAPVTCGTPSCNVGCDTGCRQPCRIEWLKPWSCEDLEKKCECKPRECKSCNSCGLLYRLLYCPKEEENGCNGNGEEKKEEENKCEAEEEGSDHGVLMQAMKCWAPSLFDRLDGHGVNVYGFIQGGFTGNFDSPRDRLNYGVNYNNRSNDVLLNEIYLITERPLDLENKKDCFHVGFRVDVMYGHDAPYFENTALGQWPNFLGDRNEASRLTEMGLGMWQYYADFHLPILTDRGVDIRMGRFISLMGHDASLGKDTLFYSRPYEFFYGVPFTNLGVLSTIHLGDTVDFVSGIVRGYEVTWQDNNDVYSYTGAFIWNACDGKTTYGLSWITGPEQIQNNHNDRTLFTTYLHHTFGNCDQWKLVLSGSTGWEQGAVVNANQTLSAGEWYGATGSLFYTINPKWTLGTRFEWWRDDDGIRTAFATSDKGGATWNRPGYAGNFYDLTFGASYKPYQNLRLRPEIRFDWFNGAAANGTNSRPFNDQRDNFQTTLGFDVIWEF